MKTSASYIRVLGFIIIAFFLLEFTVDSGEDWAIIKHPIIWAVLGMLLVFAIALEIVAGSLERILFTGLSEDAQERYKSAETLRGQNRFGWFRKKYIEMLGAKPISSEQEIVLDHNYDGIRELDNNLPPWWTYLFYISIVFALVYFVYYEVFDGPNQLDEYETEVAQAKADIAEFKKNNKDLVDAESVELLTDANDITAGIAIYTENCIACHKDGGGGGIGPNLTDNYWILGGGIKNVFHTISEGGRSGKGMIPWKTDLKPSEIAQVASYVLSLQGTNPSEPKEPEGEVWMDENATNDIVPVKQMVAPDTQTKMTNDSVVDVLQPK